MNAIPSFKKTSPNPVAIFNTLLLLLVLYLICRHFFGWSKDDTDGPGRNDRSGMTVLTDYRTGVQYLKTGGMFGAGLTVRVDANGKPVVEVKP
jgi:hypothetical protein